ncbi:MAG TPA: DUF4013 domain-containing protein [Anaerolineales bacterium]|nr:DUF4013 domain-containing protein [Anaerolineales bacterium]
MASDVTLEGVKKVVFFPFKGEKWAIKALIGSALFFLCSFIPIIPAIPLDGYFVRIMKRIILQDEDPALPEWDDWGTLFLDGIKLLGVTFIYLLPALILTTGGYILFMILDLSMVFSIPSQTSAPSNLLPSITLSMLGMFGGLIIVMLGMGLMYITLLIIPPAVGNMIARDSFGAAFQIKDWWPVFKANLSGYILAIALGIGLISLAYIVCAFLYMTIILWILLPFVFSFIIFVFGTISFSLYAVAYRDGLRKLQVRQA